MKKRLNVLVVGRGASGAAAAWSCARSGMTVSLVSDAPGATVLSSGALDWRSWTVGQAVDSDRQRAVSEFLAAADGWQVSREEMVVATLAGQVRTTNGRDVRVLELSALPDGARVGVPILSRDGWDAHQLVHWWGESSYLRDRNIAVEAFGFGPWEHEALSQGDLALARAVDDPATVDFLRERLAAGDRRWDAILLGPWLGVETNAAAYLSESLETMVGETLGDSSGPTGARWDKFVAQVLSQQDVNVRRDRLVLLEADDERVRVQFRSGRDDSYDAVVLAVGGLVGGGIVWNQEEPESAAVGIKGPASPSFSSNLALRIGGEVNPTPGSSFGLNLDELRWPDSSDRSWLLDEIFFDHVDHRACTSTGAVLDNVIIVGEAGSGAASGLLGAIASGLSGAQVLRAISA